MTYDMSFILKCLRKVGAGETLDEEELKAIDEAIEIESTNERWRKGVRGKD